MPGRDAGKEAPQKRPEAARRLRDGLLAGLGLLSALLWWNLGLFHHDGYVHLWEQYHYYIGSRYVAELGYTELYACSTVADFEDGLQDRARARRIRDMRTNRVVGTAELLSDPGRCKERFTGERWSSFKKDNAWFRERITPPRWERLFRDHGYNAPPAWGVAGATLARLLPASHASILGLALADPLLLVAMWVMVFRAFGWRATCVALIWWGTNQLAHFGWTGGGFLRQDWLALAVIGICLVKRRRMALGGFALTYASLLRIFPGFIVAALLLKAGALIWRRRRFVLSPEHARFAVGCLAALVLLVPLSFLTSGGPGSWGAFVENSRANVRSAGMNTVGLMVVLSYEHENRRELLVDPALEDPDRDWLDAKRRAFQRWRGVGWVLLLGFLVLLARAVRDEEDWAALTLGIGLIPFASFVACYYFSFLLGYGLLWKRQQETVGLLLCALSVASHSSFLIWDSGPELDQRYAAASLAALLAVTGVTLAAWRRRVPA